MTNTGAESFVVLVSVEVGRISNKSSWFFEGSEPFFFIRDGRACHQLEGKVQASFLIFLDTYQTTRNHMRIEGAFLCEGSKRGVKVLHHLTSPHETDLIDATMRLRPPTDFFSSVYKAAR